MTLVGASRSLEEFCRSGNLLFLPQAQLLPVKLDDRGIWLQCQQA